MQTAPAAAAFAACFRAGDAAPEEVTAGARAWFDGGLHNLRELRAELGLRGDAPLAQVLIAAWQRWGERIGEHLDGVFALAVSDAAGVLLLRDASGLCGLYTDSVRTGELWFGSVLDLSACRRGVPRSLARCALHEYLRLGDIAAPRTIFEHALAAEPGVPLLYEGQSLRLQPMSAPAAAAAAPATFQEAGDRLDTLLREAVARRLSDAVRPAAFLSSGVDSALLCAIAAPQRPDITAITVGFEGAGFDEAPVAARIAGHLGITHRVLRFGRNAYLEAFDRLAHGMDQPMADPAAMATLLAFEHCREHFDVVLDGTGADEAVGVMPPRHARLAVGVGSLVPTPLRKGLVGVMSRIPPLAGYTPIFDFEHPAEVLLRWKGFSRTEIEALCAEPVSLETTTFYRSFARFPRHAHFARYSALFDAMPGDRLTQAMRLSGLCVRFPFLARDVNALLRQLPTTWRHLPGQPKRILRELLARSVPREIWHGPKQGFNFPLHEFLAGDDHALVRRHLLEGRWLARGLLRADLVQRYAQRYMAGELQLMFRVWALVVLGAWLDAHDDVQSTAHRA